MNNDKKYGLILSEKTKIKQPVFQATHNVFGNDSDSDDEFNKKPVLLRPSDSVNRQGKINQEKAISEDPTVYQYDEIYESMINKKEEVKEKVKEAKKPRYIENLIKAANKRKIENERRLERQVQKERENEGDEFADKEVFVTSAYKKKLEEMKQEEEREKYEEYLESIGDVTKQKDLGGFYRHLYDQKLGTDRAVADKSADKQEQSNIDKTDSEKRIVDNDKPQTKNRNYRKRKTSADNKQNLSDGEIEDSDEEINRFNLEDIRLSKKAKQIKENIDADSDFSIDDSDDEENENKNNELNEVKTLTEKKDGSNSVNSFVENTDKTAETDEKQLSLNKSNTEALVVKKIDIWKKRTVGEVFDQALKRYYERKASRSH